MATTIRDLMISPYEIDVDKNNFTLVEVSISKPGEVAGRETEGGKRVRKVVGYFSTFAGCMQRIARERISLGLPDLEDKIVDIKTFLKEQEAYKQLFIKWTKFLSAPFEITEEDGLPVVSPKKMLKNLEIIKGKEDEE